MVKQLLLLCMALLCAGAVSAQTCTLVNSFTTKKRLVSNNPNSVKLFDVSVDETRAKAWISPIMNPYLTSVNLNTLSENNDSLPVEIVGTSPTNVKFILVNPYNGYVLVSIAGENTLKLYNPESSSLVGTYTFSSTKGGMEVDAVNNQFLVCDGTNIRFLSGNNLSTLGSDINFGISVASVIVDASNLKIWAASKNLIGGNVVLKKYNLNTRASENNYNIAASEVMGVQALDAAHNRLIMGGLTQIKDINLTTGAVSASYSIGDDADDYAYAVAQQKLFVTCSEAYAGEGVHGKWSKRYEIDLSAGTSSVVNLSGDKVSRLAVDNTRNLLIEPNMHRGIVNIKNLVTSVKTTLDVGDSADDMCVYGNTLYCVNRLGGSKITVLNAATNNISSVDAGVWPCVNRVDAGLGYLFVLNHFTSSIERRSATGFQLIDSLLLGVSECREDAISTMFLDQNNHKIYVVFPELSTLVVADGQTMSLDANLDLSGWFNYNGAGGLGDLQVVAGAGKIFVFDKYSHRLQRYDASTYADEGFLNLSPNWTGQTMDEAALAWDEPASRVICGDLVIHPTGAWTPAAAIETDLNAGGVFAGYNAATDRRIFISQNTSGQLSVAFYNAVTNALTASQTLFTYIGAPSFCVDQINERLFFGEFTTSRIWYYSFSSTPLPVEITTFEAERLPSSGAVRLKWELGNEQDIARYSIERLVNRSENDISAGYFSPIGIVQASGRSSYSFDDQSPEPGTNHYRLRMEAFDGSYTHSPIRAVTVEARAATLSLFPNPTHAVINLKHAFKEGEIWRVTDVSGRKMLETEGDASAVLDLSGLPSGVFWVEISNGEAGVVRARFLKQ